MTLSENKISKAIEEAKETTHKAKEIVVELLSEPMNENQKMIVLKLYKLLK